MHNLGEANETWKAGDPIVILVMNHATNVNPSLVVQGVAIN